MKLQKALKSYILKRITTLHKQQSSRKIKNVYAYAHVQWLNL